MTALWSLSATDIAAKVRGGTISATDAVTAHLERIDSVNPSVNAVVRRLDHEALERAEQIDADHAAGRPLGPLAGVPFSIKDNIDLAGDPTTHGTAEYADVTPTLHAPIVERMLAAGAIPIGRTNLPDLGLRMHTDSSLHGRTRNPWSPIHTTGGSSGGDAAALATGMAAVGLGNDLGGSLRNPATCCSIASLKPTFGRVPHALQGPLADESLVEQLIAVEGPMARTVADVRLALRVLAGAHPRDPWSVPAAFSERPAPLRIGMISRPPGGSTDPRVAHLVEQSGAWLRDAGHVVDELDITVFGATLDCWHTLVVGSLAKGLHELRPVIGPDALRFIESAVASSPVAFSDDAIEAGWTSRHQLIQSWNELFRTVDAVVTPTWTQLPFRHAEDLDPAGAASVLESARSVYPANVLGFPAAAVPAGVVDGLPVGVMVTGPAWADLTCLSVAEAIEARNIAPSTPIDPKDDPHG